MWYEMCCGEFQGKSIFHLELICDTTDIFICTNGKAFNIVTTAHLLTTLIQEHLVDLGCF